MGHVIPQVHFWISEEQVLKLGIDFLLSELYICNVDKEAMTVKNPFNLISDVWYRGDNIKTTKVEIHYNISVNQEDNMTFILEL